MAFLKEYVEFLIYKYWGRFYIILRLRSVILEYIHKGKIMVVNGKLQNVASF